MVPGDRRLRILALFGGDEAPELETKRICQVAAQVTGATGAGIMLMSGDVPRGPVCTSDEVSAVVEQLQFDLGEGPCIDAYRQDWPVLEPDLAEPDSPRWLAFSSPAVEAGVRAIFGFPLQVGAIRLGALNLYRDQPGPLSDDQHADALVMADVAAQALLVLQAGAPPGTLAAELEAGADFQYAVHQASGMVAAQLESTVGHAFIRLRSFAFGNNRRLKAVAEDVVARRLRFCDTAGDVAGTL